MAVSGRRVAAAADFFDCFRRDFMKNRILLQVVRDGRLYQVRMAL